MNKISTFLRLLAELNKLRITIIVTLTTLAGYTLASGHIDTNAILPLLGIFILACGSAAMNQFQERKFDVLMVRTQNRPIPAGKISPKSVFLIASAEIIMGTWIVYAGSNFETALLGFMAFVWYNLIYTPLKRVTAFAVIPGSVIGSIPPMVGWIAGGGSWFDPDMYLMASFFFISQVPHFWLLTLKYGEEYHKAGFPVITNLFSPQKVKRVTFEWIAATSLNILMLVIAGLFESLAFKIIVSLSAIWLVVGFLKLLKKSDEDFNPFQYFMKLNYVLLVIIISMIVDPLL